MLLACLGSRRWTGFGARPCVFLKQHELSLVALGLKLPLTVSQQICLSRTRIALSRQYVTSSDDPLGVVGFAGCAEGNLGVALTTAGRSVTGVRVRV